MGAVWRFVTGRRSAWVVLAFTILAAGAVIALGGSPRVAQSQGASLPDGAQSTQVEALLERFPSAQRDSLLVVYSRPGGALTEADVEAATAVRTVLAPFAADGEVSPPQVSDDRQVAFVAVTVPALGDTATADEVERVRAAVRGDTPAGLQVQVTGGPAVTADLDSAFDGANTTLLLVTAAVVAVLLLVTYRSPILWLVPLAVVAIAEQVSAKLGAIVSRVADLSFDGQVTGIASVLVFGAGTDYALLLIARYREELTRRDDRREAMRAALGSAAPAIFASGGTVILALLTLLLAVLGADRAIGIASATGIGVALLAGLFVLPAALVVLPRGVFWPRVPHVATDGHAGVSGTAWRRIGEATVRRPWRVIVGSTVLLGALASGTASTSLGLSLADTFRTSAESIDGLQTLSRGFPAGAADPAVVVTSAAATDATVAAARAVPGVASVDVVETSGDLTRLAVVLTPEPDSTASFDAVRDLRAAVAAVPGSDAVVGGSVARDLDVREAALRDLRLIAPLILGVVLVILVVLLRSVVAPLVLGATVVASFFGALGGASLLFTYVLGFPGLDPQVPLFAFLFLVALGVDYNIFLVTRAREEAVEHGTREGMLRALAVTGGVITSAGVLLAAVFVVLGVLPVTVLTQIGTIVCVGVLLDTLLVRTVVVPALAAVLGRRFWWPARVEAAAEPREEVPGADDRVLTG